MNSSAGRNFVPVLFSVFVATTTLWVSAGCRPDRLWVRVRDAKGREAVPLDVAWETPLEICCKPGPYAPEEAEATCSPSDRCKALITRETRHAYTRATRVDVIGLSPGPVDVELRYRRPESNEWSTERVHLEFVAAPQRQTLELGKDMPKGPFLLEHLSPELLARGVRGPARCEREGDDRDQFACFSPIDVLGDRRYPSCAHSERCGESLRAGRFRIAIDRDDETGRVSRVKMGTEDGQEQLGEWQSSGGQTSDVGER